LLWPLLLRSAVYPSVGHLLSLDLSPSHPAHRNLDIILIRLFDSSSAKFGDTIWSELGVVVNEIEETIDSLQFQTAITEPPTPADLPLPLPPLIRPSEPQRSRLDEDIPKDLSACRKMMKQLRKYLPCATGPERCALVPSLL
jgi:hypothetical protein